MPVTLRPRSVDPPAGPPPDSQDMPEAWSESINEVSEKSAEQEVQEKSASLKENGGGAEAGAGSRDPETGSAPAVTSAAPAPSDKVTAQSVDSNPAAVSLKSTVADTAQQAPATTAELTSSSFVNEAMRHPAMAMQNQQVSAAAANPSVGSAKVPVAGANVGMIVLGVGLIAALTIVSVLGILFYRRRLRHQDAAMMFVEVGEKDIPTRPPPAAHVKSALKAKKIGDPMLVNTTAAEAIRGPGLIAAGPHVRSPSLMRSASTSSVASKKKKPTLSLSMYRQNNLGSGSTLVSPSPSPRYRAAPDAFGEDLLHAKTPTFAPSPRRQTSFDCAPSPLPMDGRQRYGRYDYGESAGPVPTPAPRVVGHRRSISNANRPPVRHSRQAVYGQNLLNRASNVSTVSNDSLLSVPISSRYSFDGHDEVHGMI